MRKKYLASLESRTATEIAEEEALFVELKRLEQNERRFKKERDDLLRTLLGIESGLQDIQAEEEGAINTQMSESISTTKKTRKKAAAEPIPLHLPALVGRMLPYLSALLYLRSKLQRARRMVCIVKL